MHNPRLAARYAKSLIDLATEQKLADRVYADMQYIKAVIKASSEFAALLKSPVVANDKKNTVLKKVLESHVSELTMAFLSLVVLKNRDQNLPEIVEVYIDQYNDLNGIHKVKLTTAAAVSDDVKNLLTQKIKQETGFDKIELELKTNQALIGGFILEYHNNLVDASALKELREIKKQFQTNQYVQNIR